MSVKYKIEIANKKRRKINIIKRINNFIDIILKSKKV